MGVSVHVMCITSCMQVLDVSDPSNGPFWRRQRNPDQSSYIQYWGDVEHQTKDSNIALYLAAQGKGEEATFSLENCSTILENKSGIFSLYNII